MIVSCFLFAQVNICAGDITFEPKQPDALD